MSNTSTLTDLTRDVAHFLGLPGDLDLPELASAALHRSRNDPAWIVKAQLRGCGSDTDRWNALSAWAAFLGGIAVRGRAWESSQHPSGYCWEGRVMVTFAGTVIEIWTGLDAEFELPEQVHVTGPVAALLIGGEVA